MYMMYLICNSSKLMTTEARNQSSTCYFQVQFVKTCIYFTEEYWSAVKKVININLEYIQMCIYGYINVESIKLICQKLKLNVKNYLISTNFYKNNITGEILLFVLWKWWWLRYRLLFDFLKDEQVQMNRNMRNVLLFKFYKLIVFKKIYFLIIFKFLEFILQL